MQMYDSLEGDGDGQLEVAMSILRVLYLLLGTTSRVVDYANV